MQQVKIIKLNMKEIVYNEGENYNFLFLIKEGEVEL